MPPNRHFLWYLAHDSQWPLHLLLELKLVDGMTVYAEFFALAIAYDEIEALALGVSCPFDESVSVSWMGSQSCMPLE